MSLSDERLEEIASSLGKSTVYGEITSALRELQSLRAQPSPRERERIADRIVRDVMELPDRNSPDDTPDMMLVTGEELHNIVCERLDTYDPTTQPFDEPLRHVDTEPSPREGKIKHMVDRFLGWRLPENFSPDAGISFKATFNEHTPWPMKHEPTGTNLFDSEQAEAMVRYMIEGMPKEQPSPREVALERLLEQAQACILGDTPEDMTHEEARQDTLEKIKRALTLDPPRRKGGRA
jgi:hypothetical protein